MCDKGNNKLWRYRLLNVNFFVKSHFFDSLHCICAFCPSPDFPSCTLSFPYPAKRNLTGCKEDGNGKRDAISIISIISIKNMHAHIRSRKEYSA